MGAADVVPGVSGGTIAFITGIYEELIRSLKSIDITALKLLIRCHFKEFYKKINGSFLFPVLIGIVISLFSLARLMSWLLANYPIEVWSLFFGLIAASAVQVAMGIERWKNKTFGAFILGIVVAYYITILPTTTTPDGYWFIFLAGVIAICAMILPGISGSFILLLLGKYQYMIDAVSNLKFAILGIFAAGALCGLVLFSRLLTWLFEKGRDVMIALLTGFMVGSLNKVWPWKLPYPVFGSDGLLRGLGEKSVMPNTYHEFLQMDPFSQDTSAHIAEALIFCALGIAIIVVMEAISRSIKANSLKS